MQVFPQYEGPMRQWPEIALMPGAAAVVERLSPTWRLALATNAADSCEVDIRAALQRAGIVQWMDAVFCFENLGARKPSISFFHGAAAALGVPFERVVMVGDHLDHDVLGAKKAGLHAVWYRRGYKGRFPAGIPAVASLEELPAVVELLVPLE